MSPVQVQANVTEKSSRVPVASAIARELRQRIVKGIYRPHLYLPSERQLANDFQTSRVTIANALESLANDGLVARTRGRGTRVLPLLERLSQPRIGVVHGELPATQSIPSDSLRTLQGVREALDRLGYVYELVSAPQEIQEHASGQVDAGNKAADHRLAFFAQFGAILLIEQGYCNQEMLHELERRRIPVVIAKLESNMEACATYVDHAEQLACAVQTLVGLGHRRIAFAGREPGYGFHGRAREGYLAGMRKAMLSADDALIAICAKTDALSAYFATRWLLSGTDPPTAIVAARDAIAEGVCRAVQEAGLIVGHHVSVIGYDDMTWPEGHAFLTTFSEPCYEMGVVAAEMLVERIVDGRIAPEKRKFDAPFMLRRTAGPKKVERMSPSHGIQ